MLTLSHEFDKWTWTKSNSLIFSPSKMSSEASQFFSPSFCWHEIFRSLRKLPTSVLHIHNDFVRYYTFHVLKSQNDVFFPLHFVAIFEFEILVFAYSTCFNLKILRWKFIFAHSWVSILACIFDFNILLSSNAYDILISCLEGRL